MISLQVNVYAEEVLLRLDQVPKKLQTFLRMKFEQIFATVSQDLFKDVPGKYLDPKFIQNGIEQQGSLLIGFIEAKDKPGFYEIYPTKANLLRFLAKDQTVVHTPRVLRHPFLKATPIVERYLEEKKPWIINQLNEAVNEALRS